MFDWTQTPKNLTIKIPIPYKIDAKKFESQITDSYLKVNILDPKIFRFIDFHENVDFKAAKIVIEDKNIVIFLFKLKEEIWPQIESKLTKEELVIRRKISEENYFKEIEKNKQKAHDTKKDLEKFVFNKSMQMDQDKRKELRDKKSNEKSNVESDLYEFVKSYDKKEDLNEENIKKNALPALSDVEENIKNDQNFDKNEKINTSKNEDKVQVQENAIVPIKKNEIKSLENKDKDNTNLNKRLTNEIFDDETIEKNKSQIRPETKMNVNLTEKEIPHFAARESLSKDPPYPKSKKFVPEKNHLGQDIEDRNPIWTKERADNLFKNKDFKSAIAIYTRAIELDETFHKVYLNRATCYMMLGQFELALSDLNQLESLLNAVDKRELEEQFYQKILGKVYIKMYAIYGIKNEFKKALIFIDKIKECKILIETKIMDKINKDKELIEKRLFFEEKKLIADECLKNGNLKEAEEKYIEILEESKDNLINKNEKILSNLSLISLNNGDYEKCISFCDEIIKIIKNFKEKITLNRDENLFHIKILLRRAKSYEKINDITKSQSDIEAAERLEIRNNEINKDINSIKNDLKMKILEKYKENANSLLEKGQFSDALELYDKSISLAKFLPKIEGLKLLLNRASCLVKLGLYGNSLEEFSRIISVLGKQKNIAIINSNYDQIEKIKQLEFLTYVKKAFVNTQLKNIYEAIQDYNKALEIKPDDKKISDNLNILKSSI